MKSVLNFFISTRLTFILLLIFALSMGVATFIEEKLDTITAQLLVYQAKWFEVLLVLMAINFIGNISRFRMFSFKKISGLTFHLAFVLMIIGAGLTRYIGFEGNLHIREGQSNNVLFSSVPYLQMVASNGTDSLRYERKLVLSEALGNGFNIKQELPGLGDLEVNYKKYFKNATESIVENTSGGKDLLEVLYAVNNDQHTEYLPFNEVTRIGMVKLALNTDADSSAIRVDFQNNKASLIAPFEMYRMQMSGVPADTIPAGTLVESDPNSYFTAQGVSFMFKRFYRQAARQIVPGSPDQPSAAALFLDVTYKGKTEEMIVFGGSGYLPKFSSVIIEGIKVDISYGDKEIKLPFSLYLNDFILDRYAGSMSPSSYASEVTLLDPRKNLEERHRIYMNNVLDYGGYRFFQSSYDTDEKGTILSVNHDFWGTWVSYLGYFLLGVGFVLNLISKNSRFRIVSGYIRDLRLKRKALAGIVLFFALLSPAILRAQNSTQKPIDKEHAERFGKVMVQTFDGRFEPIHTLAIDVLHKISRKDHFEAPGKGDLTPLQVFVDMIVDGNYWQNQKMIYIREKSVRDVLGIQGKHASIMDFYDQNSKYKLAQYTETSFRKKQAEQNSFDREIIRLDERVNVYFQTINGSMLRIFPVKGSPTHKWISPFDTVAFMPLTGEITAFSADLGLPQMSYNSLFRLYMTRCIEATQSGDYTIPNKILGIIEASQRQYTPEHILPTENHIKLEIFYNNANIFILLRNVFGLLSVILLGLAFLDVLRSKRSKTLDLLMNIFIGMLAMGFLYHTFGMGLRWYLSGHAPWSNGYEALLLMSWGSLLAGFLFMRYSKITLAATVLLAASMLMTASHSSYDPQLTNLQPVLKSYWLIIHVAAITISYGFLALGFALGMINLFIMLFKNQRNKEKLSLLVQELTYINEMNLTIGLFLATLGTFLGGVWANESWGRYWGWDAKETWALVIVIAYTIVLHFRMIPKMKSVFTFNVGSVIAFASVLMTFIGVNYYLSKGLHSYAADDTPVFPIWAWIMIFSVILLMVLAGLKENRNNKENKG